MLVNRQDINEMDRRLAELTRGREKDAAQIKRLEKANDELEDQLSRAECAIERLEGKDTRWTLRADAVSQCYGGMLELEVSVYFYHVHLGQLSMDFEHAVAFIDRINGNLDEHLSEIIEASKPVRAPAQSPTHDEGSDPDGRDLDGERAVLFEPPRSVPPAPVVDHFVEDEKERAIWGGKDGQ